MMNTGEMKAFTFIELILAILIVSILAGLGTPFLVSFFDSFQYNIYRRDLSQSADVALRMMSMDIRRLQESSSVITANATTYRFIDTDGITVQYSLNGDELEREYNGNTNTLIAAVESFTFTYLDDDATTVITAPAVSPQPTDVKFVQVEMILSERGNTIEYKELIKLRNIIHITDLFA
jgi:prepilin-type N-terminal cleavage/methylation domain-containing protein